MDCSEHKKEVAGISDMKVLAEMIGNLNYGTLAILLDELALKLYKDSVADRKRGRHILACELSDASDRLTGAFAAITQAYEISKPFMKNNKS